MADVRKIAVRASVTALLAVPFLGLAVLTAEIYFRAQGPDQIPPFTPCQQFSPVLRHRYKPGCSSEAGSATGMVRYSFNEDGLRDRARSFFKGPTVVALGDSITEGLYLSEEQTLPRRLEALLPGTTVLNAGIRFTGPTLQLRNYEALVEPNYRVRAVVWLLNASDVNDERLLRAEAVHLDSRGLPDLFSWFGSQGRFAGTLAWLNQRNQGRSELVSSLVRLATFSLYRSRVRSIPPTRENLCGGIFALAARLKEKRVPLLVIFTPHLVRGIERNWPGEKYEPEQVSELVACAKEASPNTLDLSSAPLREEWFAADGIHYSAEGAAWLATRLEPEVAALLGTGAKNR